jgi:hypothetical protein
MRFPRRRALAALCGLGATLAGAGSAAAEPSAADKETSRGLYREGIHLLETRDFAGAERACRGAHALVQAPTSTSCWARALESLGRLIEARDAFLEAARYPAAAGEPAVFTSARESAREEADALATRIPTIVLAVSGAPEGAALTATVDGAPIAPDTVRLPRKIDPGPHVVVVEAPGFRPVRVEVNAGEGRQQQVPVALQATSDGAPPAPLPASAPARPQAPAPWLTYASFGVGAAGLALGLAAGLAAGAKDSTIAAECAGSVCPASARADIDSFHSLKTLSAAGYVVGAAGVLAGATLWVMTPRAPAGWPSAALWVGPGSAGLSGAF